MNTYERLVLPRLIDLAMRNPEATRHRQKLIPAARGACSNSARAPD